MTSFRNSSFQAKKKDLQKHEQLKFMRLWKTIPMIIELKKNLGINVTKEVQDISMKATNTAEQN